MSICMNCGSRHNGDGNCLDATLRRVAQAERERDDARADHRRSMHAAIEQRERLAQAVALLREAPDKSCDCEEGRTCLACEYNARKGSFLDGQPEPESPKCSHGLPWWLCSMHRNDAEALISGQTPVVDDAMVEKAYQWFTHPSMEAMTLHESLRAALVAALEGKL